MVKEELPALGSKMPGEEEMYIKLLASNTWTAMVVMITRSMLSGALPTAGLGTTLTALITAEKGTCHAMHWALQATGR